jgi:3-oxoisoapionate kinase
MTNADHTLPSGTIVSWYGDDFTGAAAVMEVMTFSGLPAVLFFEPPNEEWLRRFPGYRGIGIAGVARAKSPMWMDRELPAIFESLAKLGAPIAQYKICSTLDSAPDVGSIGHATEIAIPYLGGAWHPLVVAAPAVGRFQAFGNLFASFNSANYRIDRHPTMSRHPVTPMGEADVRRHLAKQTARKIGLIDLLALRHSQNNDVLARVLDDGAEIVAFDAVDENDLARVGELIWNNRGSRTFAIGSQGLEYALISYWRREGLLEAKHIVQQIDPVERLAVVSGSCAPQTAAQISLAIQHGFEAIRVDVTKAVDQAAWDEELERRARLALAALSAARDPIVFTALGPDDPAIGAYHNSIVTAGADPMVVNERIGAGLGRLLDGLIRAAKIRRGVIIGGDTSSNGANELGIHAMTALAPTIPGAALFQTYSDDPDKAGLEIALKGGQMGAHDFLLQLKRAGIDR